MSDAPHEPERDTPSSASGRDPSRRCPICGEAVPVDREDPFCSDRCKKIDLGKWLSGDYRISRPIEQSDLEEGD